LQTGRAIRFVLVMPQPGKDQPMRPGRPPAQEPDGLFKTPLDRFIDMGHPLVRLADRIDWEGLETQVASCFAEAGRPAAPARFASVC